MPIGQLHKAYMQQMVHLSLQSAYMSDATKLEAQRQWQRPFKTLEDQIWNENVLDFNDLVKPFNRATINDGYKQAIDAAGQDGGRLADVMVNKIQNDHLGAMERAVVMRYMTKVRAMLHASGRRHGHGSGNGILVKHLTDLADLLASGYGSGTPTTASSAGEPEE